MAQQAHIHCVAVRSSDTAAPGAALRAPVRRLAETELVEACSPANLDIAFLPWSPLCGGALTGKYLEEDVDVGARFRRWPLRYARYDSPRVRAAVEKYCKVALEADCAPAELALAFCKCGPRSHCACDAMCLAALLQHLHCAKCRCLQQHTLHVCMVCCYMCRCLQKVGGAQLWCCMCWIAVMVRAWDRDPVLNVLRPATV